jgi:hypothetical protein
MRHYSFRRRIPFFILIAAAAVMVITWIVMTLWNALLPQLFHLPLITFWQALGLLVLSKILFGGFRGGGPGSRWKGRMDRRWMNMSPEERERFKQEWANRCGRPFGPQSPGTNSPAGQAPGPEQQSF